MAKVPARLEGRMFGHLLVLSRVRMTPSGSLWACKCSCGGDVEKLTSQLKRVKTAGCRACETERRSAVHVVHGAARGCSNGGKTRLYKLWKDMTKRCRNPSHASWKYYGAKGIKVCDQWLSFPAFKAWAEVSGYEDALSIERVNPRENYTPENCEWITRSENSRRAAAGRRSRTVYARAGSLGLEMII